MMIVSGATGQLGAAVVETLLQRVPAEQIGVSVRDPRKAERLAERGVRVRRGDFTDPDSLVHAFEDASQVLVVSVDVLGEQGIAQSIAAIDAAYRAGAERVVYTSHQAAAAGSHFAPARDHAAVEAQLEQGGRPWTSLRNGYYASSLLFHLGDAVQSGELAVPADGPVAWTSRDDLAEANAAILADPGRFEGPTPPLVATDAVDLDQVVAMLSEIAGRPVRRSVVDDDTWVQGLIARGMPGQFADIMLGTFRASRDGEFAVSDPTLRTLLGREPDTVRTVLRQATTSTPAAS